ncbi:conjugal transfer protein TraV [Klebsiella sp. PL-2018]|uniref:conjugal transfer protein TraV n=1 Tax=Klebsiella sp. PL-2018 TaxID=2851540 RepID=UPI001C21D272|nr:conjugal transfer protein TraV [Klebsiella sp. PL-2018]QXD00997.1 IncI1 plasmid conjugative transfer protein TraV [Klebsiella sp. PL-2018]
MTVIHLTPRCRRPPDGVVRLDGLWLHTAQANYAVSVRSTRLAPATTPLVLEVVSARPSATPAALRLKLRDWPQTLLTTARWQVTLPHAAPVLITHVVHWLLPATPAPVLTDDTWLWHLSPDAPRISPGDWPRMDVLATAQRRPRRCSLSVIDTLDRSGIIVRRYQAFPLAPLTDDCLPSGVPFTPLVPARRMPCV